MTNGLLFIFVDLAVYIFLAFVVRKIWQEKINPISIILSFYLCISLISYVALRNYVWGFHGLYWIVGAMIILCIGGILGKYLFSYKTGNFRKKVKTDFYPSNISWAILCAFIALGFINWLYQVRYSGFSLKSFFSIEELASMNNIIAVNRYAGQSQSNVIIKILNIFLYATPLCGGFLLPFSNTKKKRVVALLSMFPIILLMLFCNGKSGFLASVLLFMLSWYSTYYYARKKVIRINGKYVLRFMVIGALILSCLLFSMVLRTGDVSWRTFHVIVNKFLIYAFGEIQAFDCWLSSNYKNITYSLGAQTFTALFMLVGLATRKQGVYSLMPDSLGNVYTLFRGLIDDFGLFGSLLFVSISGVLMGILFERLRYSKKIPSFALACLIGIQFFYLYGYIISPWVYSSYIVSFVIFYIFIKISYYNNIKLIYNGRVLSNENN